MKVRTLYSAALALNLAGFSFVSGVMAVLGTESGDAAILMRAVLLALSLFLILLALVRRSFGFVHGVFWLFLLVFWGAYVLRLVNDTIWTTAPLSRAPADYWIWAFGTCLLPMLAMLTRSDLDTLGRAYRWVVPMLLVAGTAVLFAGDTMVGEAGTAYNTGRVHLEALSPISVGHLGVSMLLIAVWTVLQPEVRKSRKVLLWAVFSVAIGLYLTVSASSRGPVASMIFVALFYIVAINPSRAWKPLFFFACLMLAGYFAAIHLAESGQSSFLSRMEGALSGGDAAVSGRQQSLAGAVHQFISSPMVGDALEERTTHFYPHNVIAESFMATGLLGGIPFLLLISYGLFCAFRLVKDRVGHAWVALIFTQYLVGAQFSGALYNATTMWAFLGVTISLHLSPQLRQASRLTARHGHRV